MAMDIMKKRLGLYLYGWKAQRYQEATRRYIRQVEPERVSCMKYEGDFTILVRRFWKHRFFGITREGVPIWTRKGRHNKQINEEVCYSLLPESQNEIYYDANECKTDEVKSFVKWMETSNKLAFIYLGIFWTLEEGETLNDAAKRFVLSHQEVKTAFKRNQNQGVNSGISEDNRYIYELFRDGALVFNKGKAILCDAEFFWKDISGLWAIMVAEGFLEKENIKEVAIGIPFKVWYEK